MGRTGIVLKHGIGVAAVLAAWVLVKHYLLRLEGAAAQTVDGVAFNAVALAGIVLGIREARAKNGGALTFLDGFKTGVAVAVTYAILMSLFFVAMLAIVGPALMKQEGETSKLQAFLGVSAGFALFGAVFSAGASLALRRRGAPRDPR